MEVSRVIRGKLSLKKNVTSLQDILKSSVETIETLVQSKGQVFSKLLSNSTKFTLSGGKISVTLNKDNEEAVVLVQDNGIGIPSDKLESQSVLLDRMGHSIKIASNGLEALEVAETFRPDIILMDIGMPVMNGYEAAKQIRKRKWGQDIKLIAVTGRGQDVDREKTKKAGFDQHLVKPVKPQDLRKVIE